MSDGQGGPEVAVIAGPTAAGKTAAALDLVERLGGPEYAEILNADSMQVYAGMDIGTGKITPDQMRGITHHLFDLWPVTHDATVAEYQAVARDCIADVRSRGKLPILVGGSGLYITAVIDDLRFPGTDPAVRARLESELAERGAAALHERLADTDPQAASRILPSNGRRLVRALEVIELTGEPFSAQLPQLAGDRPVYRSAQVALDWPAPLLAERIAARVQQMWRDGLVDEVAQLREQGIEQGRTASRALGYAQVLAFLRGEISEDDAREQTTAATRRFARRQRSWLRRDPRISWFDVASGVPVDELAHTITA
ncbi:tRNA (adenosine(37)-N6)-dimethylallyltransferase MiaA [Epidermidibacterium keratini]|uniref:tRNA (adenosine(37)-N6)-dimethylallyltransferase MiaA n=1 Tax=Epidermidibacterium keratini TaxID=1891644 RepID=UPI001CEF7933|nr:tRNA (adenosine(37)-N6)-dimethylallyltransferase MiaA [Epidermidibacterium keratini]